MSPDENAIDPLAASGLAERHGELLTALQHLQSAVDGLRERSKADQEVMSRMQARIEALQADQVRALLGPVVTELAGLHADLTEAAGRDFETLGFARVRKEFGLLGDRIENAMDLLGAVSVGAKQGQSFDSRLHTAVRQIPASDPALDKKIAAVLRQGFMFQHESKPALYARVSVYRYDSTLAALAIDTLQEAPPPSLASAAEKLASVVSAGAMGTSIEDSPFQVPFESKKE